MDLEETLQGISQLEMATPVSHGVLSELIIYSQLSPNVHLVMVVLLEEIRSRIMRDKVAYEGT